MRIIAGDFRGRRLHTPRGVQTRPTTDRVREAVFSMIAVRVPEASVLDLFAGTGAMGLEALSRGAADIVFVDQSPAAIRIIKDNVALCRAQESCRIIQSSGEQAIHQMVLAGVFFDLVFLDPPYGKGYVEASLNLLSACVHPDALIVAECHVKDDPPDECGGWVRVKERRYGDTQIALYVKDVSA